MLEYHTIIYLMATGLFGVFLLWRLRRWFNKVQTLRKKRLKAMGHLEAVETKSPLDNPNKEIREMGLDNIETRFSVIERIILPCVVVTVLFAMSVPFLGQLTLPGTIISLVVAATTVVVGIAARPFIENLISGVVISLSRMIRIGDTILIDGKYGTVEDVSITHTIIKQWDWRRYVIPNTLMLNKEFVNYSLVDKYQWVQVEFWVDYEADLNLVEELALAAAAKSKYFAGYEPPRLWIMEMAKEGIRCMLVAWANSPAEGWMLSADARAELIRAFQNHNIKTHFHYYKAVSDARMQDQKNRNLTQEDQNK